MVCTGNTCRSAMAEGILRSVLPPELRDQVQVHSAGTGAAPGIPATGLAISVAKARGIDLQKHHSVPLTRAHIEQSDLILCMEPPHVARALELAPHAEDRIHLITEQSAEGAEAGIRDPLGGTDTEYDDTFNRIRSHLLRWLPSIREAVERRQGVR
jgi:protein-tyrosine-phosphatase